MAGSNLELNKVRMKPLVFALILLGMHSEAFAAVSKADLAERLSQIRDKVLNLEQALVGGSKLRKEARGNIGHIQTLIKLQKEERSLGQQRMEELSSTIGELKVRRGQLLEKVQTQQKMIRRSLVEIERSGHEMPHAAVFYEEEKIEAPRRKVLSRLVDRGLKEIETLKIDLSDASFLEEKIQEEQHQLAYLFHDLREQESILELNKQLQFDVLKKTHEEKLGQLENYRKLKSAEGQVEKLIGNFNARRELEQSIESEKRASRESNDAHEMLNSAFAKLRGHLSLPVMGKIVAQFGRGFDPKSQLQVFKKGVDIASGKLTPVKAIYAGKVAFSGELPNYGRVAIVDHGDHFYSLCAHLGELKAKAGDLVVVGDVLGVSDSSGTPVYFEIRARNIPVNPLQWVSN